MDTFKNFVGGLGVGGGSPRRVLRTIAPDVRHPQTGNALSVLALDN